MREKVEKNLKKYVISLNCSGDGIIVKKCLSKEQLKILLELGEKVSKETLYGPSLCVYEYEELKLVDENGKKIPLNQALWDATPLHLKKG